MEELLSKISSIGNNKDSVVQIFDTKCIINQMHLAGAYVDMIQSFKDGTNISKSRSLEMLLFVAMTNQISDAIKKVGAKNSNDFILFANNRAAYNKIKPLIKLSKELHTDKKSQAETAKKFGIYVNEDLDKFILQKMAISRLSD